MTVYLEAVPGREFPWREFYLSIGAISCAVVAGLWVGLFPFWLLTPLEWATVIVTTFTGSAAYHTFVRGDKTLDDSLFPRNPDE